MAFRHRFLIDECLSPKRVNVGPALAEITHVNFRGLAWQPDIVIAQWCVEHDHVLVTNNGRDFRRHYADMEVHPGVVVLLPSVDRDRQCSIFAAALPSIAARPDLINTLIEIRLDGSMDVIDWPVS